MTDDTIGGLASHTIVERYLEYFGARGHLRIPGGPLVSPEGGTSFTIAGMQPLMPFLRGHRPPPAPRLTDLQRCLRTDDVDAVGTNGRKMTLFHMLGNWSIGDYGRREAIALALGLLDELGVDRATLWVTTFGGDAALGQGPDEEVAAEWRRAGMAPGRIVPLGVEDNWWGPPGDSGPCGPDSEIFVDRGAALSCGAPDCRPGCSCERFLEIWNLVFIEYEQDRDGVRTPLPLRSVDTGMGLERVAAVLQGVPSVFDIDLFGPGQRRLEELAPSGAAGGGAVETRARRLVVDHVRAALFAGLAGVAPGRDGRGSVVRRLIRRAARQGRLLGLERPFLGELVEPLMRPHLPLLEPGEAERLPRLAEALTEEERRFSRTLTAGLRLLGRLEPVGDGVVPGERVFALHADRGFPADLAAEVLAELGLRVDWEGYERALAEHRAVSRVSKEQHFGA